jgi:hypothetical protein
MNRYERAIAAGQVTRPAPLPRNGVIILKKDLELGEWFSYGKDDPDRYQFVSPWGEKNNCIHNAGVAYSDSYPNNTCRVWVWSDPQ